MKKQAMGGLGSTISGKDLVSWLYKDISLLIRTNDPVFISAQNIWTSILWKRVTKSLIWKAVPYYLREQEKTC